MHSILESYLEILPHLQANTLSKMEVSCVGSSSQHQATGHRQIEGIKGCLVRDNAHICWQVIPGEVNLHKKCELSGPEPKFYSQLVIRNEQAIQIGQILNMPYFELQTSKIVIYRTSCERTASSRNQLKELPL